MSAAFRAIAVALVLAAVVFTGALYIGYRNGVNAAQSRVDTLGNVASLNLNDLLGSRAADQQLVALAFRQVERVYYKPVDDQSLVDGERNGILSFLKTQIKGKKTAAPLALPAMHASGDLSADVRTVDGEPAFAQAHYGRYLDEGGRTDLTQAAISGMLGSLNDPYTVYLSPDQIRALNEELDGGNFGGIGVFIYQLKNGQVVLQPIEGLPAWRAGMKSDEILDRIDGRPVAGFALDRIERMIRGQEGTGVVISGHDYGKPGTSRHYSITREIIHVPTVHQKMENGYNYIRLSDFGETSADEIHRALLDGKAHHAKGTILDLRDNGGGLLDAAVAISSFFIPKGVIVTEIDRQGNKDPQYANGSTISGVTPLVVLVNAFTASASEITAGALQDYKVGTLLGTKTFGKGVVQGIFSMPNGGALKITTQRYVTPSGRDIQHKGIVPNIVVNQNPQPDVIDTAADKQLNAAKAYLNRITR